eukprot:CAMPEP_0185189824 /NCGR_PEP_ID=MMETSP1140-20130426/6266_1 /TAXON_ID=298111 /ORGANISM="Pavlova sp., Strain CCMP459" /LENGTH=349 /DNA_ID=CAMNT_0027756411 /DNA_START=46 /DNA_END=1095 /DNA_ORIENTATION=+
MSPPTRQTSESSADAASTMKLAFLAVGVWVSFVAFGWAQEHLTSHEFGEKKERFDHISALVLLQSIGNAIVAYVMLILTQGPKVAVTGGVPTSQWLVVALGYLGAHKFGLEALRYIIFPLQVVVKSCKSIPVMLGERIFAGEVHSAEKKLSVFMLTAGVLFFTLRQPKKGDGLSDFHLDPKTLYGLGLVFLALCCDGVYGPYQNKLAKTYDVSEFHLMLNMNLWQGLFALLMIIPSGELVECFDFVMRYPGVLREFGIFSATMAVGNVFIFKLQHDFGALTVTKVTTIRKLASVLYSVVIFGHKMNPSQWIGVFIVFFSNQISKALARSLGWSKKPSDAKAKGDTKKTK